MWMAANTRHKQRGNTFWGFFTGLVAGVALAAGVVWMVRDAPTPLNSFAQGGASAVSDSPKATPSGTLTSSTSGIAKISEVPAPPPPANANATPTQIAARNPEATIPPAGTPPATAPASLAVVTSTPDRAQKTLKPQFIQCGAFSKFADAANRKAEIALIGIESEIQSVLMIDKAVLYRIVVGPLATREDAESIRTRLSSAGIDSSYMKPQE